MVRKPKSLLQKFMLNAEAHCATVGVCMCGSETVSELALANSGVVSACGVAVGAGATQLLARTRRIHEANRILLLGGDMASSLVNYMEYHLTIAGLPVLAAIAPGRATHLARSTDKGDIVIGVSFRRGLRMTIEGIERARKNGAYCVGITDSMLSPLARFSNELFVVPINSLSFAASYVAPFALIDLITAGVGSLRRKQVVDRLKEADLEQKHGYRWYQTES